MLFDNNLSTCQHFTEIIKKLICALKSNTSLVKNSKNYICRGTAPVDVIFLALQTRLLASSFGLINDKFTLFELKSGQKSKCCSYHENDSTIYILYNCCINRLHYAYETLPIQNLLKLRNLQSYCTTVQLLYYNFHSAVAHW